MMESQRSPAGVTFTVAKMSFGRRTELMRQVRELGRKVEFLEADGTRGRRWTGRCYGRKSTVYIVKWGLRAVAGLKLDGVEATAESLAEAGPEALFREAAAIVRAQAGLSAENEKTDCRLPL